MEGRIVLVKLLCKDTANARVGVFSPCIAFRVAGSPGNSFLFLQQQKQQQQLQQQQPNSLSVAADAGRFKGDDAMELIHYRLVSQKNICIGQHARNPFFAIRRRFLTFLWSESQNHTDYFYLGPCR